MILSQTDADMYPIASQFVFEATNSRYCARLSDNESSKNGKRSQFEIESILKNSFCDSSVTAGSEISKSSTSYQFSFDQLSLSEEKLPKKFSVSVQTDGFVASQEPSLKHKFWLRAIRIADDIPGANVLLDIRDDKVELKTIKLINVGDELLLWFSEEVLGLMAIPFLTPANIQGKQKLKFSKKHKRKRNGWLQSLRVHLTPYEQRDFFRFSHRLTVLHAFANNFPSIISTPHELEVKLSTEKTVINFLISFS